MAMPYFPQEVVAFDVEFVDVRALVLYLSVVGDIDSGHTLEHVADGAVLFLGETADVVGYRVAVLTYAVALDNHFLQLQRTLLHEDFYGISVRLEGCGVWLVAKDGGVYCDAVGGLLDFDQEVAFLISGGEPHEFPLRIFHHHVGSGDSLSGDCFRHVAFDLRLR